jgi:hypothetical protein
MRTVGTLFFSHRADVQQSDLSAVGANLDNTIDWFEGHLQIATTAF